MSSIEQIQALLPQTQCTRCGFSGCLPYAQAIIEAGVLHNRCHPGGEAVIIELSKILKRSIIPIDSTIGAAEFRQIAFIDASKCIGCTLCLPSCPVDSIIGGPKRLHTIDPERCTGCQLCIAPCPVDCISMVNPPNALKNWNKTQRDTAIGDYAIALSRRSKVTLGLSDESEPVDDQPKPLKDQAEKQSAAKAALAAALKKAIN
jgi:Na+-translocating ferredoxin:NAD+ oxidoreductase subunit B